MNADKFVVVYENGVPTAILHEAFHVIMADEVNAESTLEFEMFFTDPKRRFIRNQAELRIGGQAYKVKMSAPVIKCKKTPRKKCNYVAERREKR